MTVATSFRNELVVTTTKKLKPIWVGAKLAIVVVVNTLVEGLKEPVTPKPIPLIIPKIEVGVKVTLIATITHAFKVFKTLDILLKDTPIAEDQDLNLFFYLNLLITRGKQPIDDLTTRV